MSRQAFTKRQRIQLQELLGDRATYVPLREGTKEPLGRYRRGKGGASSRKNEIPPQGNYGVIPEKDFFILDIDVSRGDPKSQLELFSDVFGVNFSKTLGVETPSGGLHYYIRLPAGITEPVFNGSLRPYAKNILEYFPGSDISVDADIRSSEATGYVVGPGSYVSAGKNGAIYKTPGSYFLTGDSQAILRTGDFHRLEEISPGGLELLLHLRALQLKKKMGDKTSNRDLITSIPVDSILVKLENGLRKKFPLGTIEYHRQRAFVFGALNCCYSNFALAAASAKMGIDRDSYTEDRLPFWETVADMERLRAGGRIAHSYYCGKDKERFWTEDSWETGLQKKRERLLRPKTGFTKRYPRVVDTGKIAKAIHTGNKPSQRARDAMLLIDTLFQPLCNVGARSILVARAPIAQALEISENRVGEALRLLRSKEIILLKTRQRTGLAPTYTVAEDYIHKGLTGSLKHRWLLVREDEDRLVQLVYNRFSRTFQEPISEKTYPLENTFRLARETLFLDEPKLSLNHFAKIYLEGVVVKNSPMV